MIESAWLYIAMIFVGLLLITAGYTALVIWLVKLDFKRAERRIRRSMTQERGDE